MTTLDKMLQGLANALGASLSTLTTTAKTVVGAINELKSGLTSTNTTVSGHTSTIGSGSLDTTSQTLIGAVNELASKSINVDVYEDQMAYSTQERTITLPAGFKGIISSNHSSTSGRQIIHKTDIAPTHWTPIAGSYLSTGYTYANAGRLLSGVYISDTNGYWLVQSYYIHCTVETTLTVQYGGGNGTAYTVVIQLG